MARKQSLYSQLDDLEPQFAARLLAEIEKEAKGRSSMFLLRRMTSYYDGRSNRSTRVQELETLYKELLVLKRALREPLSSGPVAVVRRYERFVAEGHYPSNEERIGFARTQLSRLKKYVQPSNSRGLTSA